ncbi:F-box protein SKIP19 [Eutrema salsugineum]|uniref:F-box protein SKIP19 n=1 Tax=Eutrema salsugineum TaxID=72664 RepID=UPI000CED2EAC|nr:F-box protein SKIP19 [Eutrema salsugineum]
MASSSSSPTQTKDEEPRNWAELPPELTASILLRLGAFEILESAQKVCMPWRRVSKDPSMWRKIDMRNLGNGRSFYYDFESMCRHAIDRSEGGLVEINIGDFGSDSLLTYIADRLKSTTTAARSEATAAAVDPPSFHSRRSASSA